MTRVLVLADTHLPRPGRSLPREVVAELDRVDLIVHLGDVTQTSVLSGLRAHAPVRAVRGNNDAPELQAVLPEIDRFDLHGHAFVLLHGHRGGKTAREAALKVTDADVVLFGHSHRAWKSEIGGILYLNPGSPTDARWSPTRAYAILEVGQSIVATIISVPTP